MTKRKTKTIKVVDIEDKEYKVEVKKNLTWGESQDIQDMIVGGAQVDKSGLKGFDTSVLRKSKYKALEICIAEIKDSNGKEIDFSKNWVDNLKAESGEKLYSSVDEIASPEKKS